ncbi:MAG TPA: hypothetical protein VFT55_10710 [Planctomycetota bacterium]|nr:hypothetical protein [Planctomycetota bacterium]
MLRLTLLVTGSLLTLHLMSAGAAWHCLDERTALYLEDAAIPRPVASVDTKVVASGADIHLVVSVSAIGACIDPLPGLDGVSGANLRTAEELDRLLREQGLQLVTRIDGRSEPGTLLSVQHGRLPARRVRPDGRLDLRTETEAVWPTCATFASSNLPDGESWCYLEADGVPRLAVLVARSGATAKVLAIDSLREPAPAVRSGGPQ